MDLLSAVITLRAETGARNLEFLGRFARSYFLENLIAGSDLGDSPHLAETLIEEDDRRRKYTVSSLMRDDRLANSIIPGEIYWLRFTTLNNELSDFFIDRTDEFSDKHVYKVIFKEEDMVSPLTNVEFDLHDYYEHGSEKYKGKFEEYIPYLSILINGIYWSEKYPRLLTKEYTLEMFHSKIPVRLLAIGDISCDIEGGIEPTLMITEPDNPVFIYNPFKMEANLGITGEGLAIMAVDNLPCELPKESSRNFSTTLKPFVPIIANVDYSVSFESLALPPIVKNAVITHRGELTPDYRYLKKFLRTN